MPDGLHTRLRKEAKLDARSVNAEIIHNRLAPSPRPTKNQNFNGWSTQPARWPPGLLGPPFGLAVLAKLEKEIAVEQKSSSLLSASPVLRAPRQILVRCHERRACNARACVQRTGGIRGVRYASYTSVTRRLHGGLHARCTIEF
jgi:hypothetical protein